MTHPIDPAPRRTLPFAVCAALLLAGCSSGHVGESWQCPLAEAGTCDSVAAADPAVPDAAAARDMVLAEPFWRVRETRTPGPAIEADCDADCDGGFDPLAWLARLFGGETAQQRETAATGPTRLLPIEARRLSAPPAEPPAAEPGSAALPGEPDAPESRPVADDPAGADLRTDEVVARVWIAPFVDVGGVYREASHVRVVLEPAGWRLGR